MREDKWAILKQLRLILRIPFHLERRHLKRLVILIFWPARTLSDRRKEEAGSQKGKGISTFSNLEERYEKRFY